MKYDCGVSLLLGILTFIVGYNNVQGTLVSSESNCNDGRCLQIVPSCSSDEDCGREEYCGGGECKAFGTCTTLADCYNPSNTYIRVMCAGHVFCDEENQSCGVDCLNPCPPGVPVTDFCRESPCSAVSCDESYVSCVDYYCGGCNAFFFDEMGNQVCDGGDTLPSLSPPRCSSDGDCVEGEEYCAQGYCQPMGTCETYGDCLNPSNSYPMAACFGSVYCDENRCQIDCLEPCNTCFISPCEESVCIEEYEACVDDPCGCDAFYFDATGNQVCEDGSIIIPPPSFPPLPSGCSSDRGCLGGAEYCAQGICQPLGTCETLSDCLNPSNTYELEDCVGYIYCDENRCQIDCSEPCNTNENCPSSPCRETICIEEHVSCVDYYCLGCDAFFFDAMGNQVCDDAIILPPPAISCFSDSDCFGGDEYCAQGICRPMGTCETLGDCLNPSNSYPTVDCFGYLYCEENSCLIDCTEPCNINEGDCPNSPCRETICIEDHVTCVDYFCNGCEAFFFDEMGNQVCDIRSLPPLPTPPRISLCSSDFDCIRGEEYCSQGECQPFGYCTDLADCINPSNAYIRIECLGFEFCDENTNSCQIDCSGACLRDPTECPDLPCEETICIEPYVTCVDRFCDGCNAFFFDASGNHVCDGEEVDEFDRPVIDGEDLPPLSCSSDDDCIGGEEYCDQGECQPIVEDDGNTVLDLIGGMVNLMAGMVQVMPQMLGLIQTVVAGPGGVIRGILP